MSKFVLRFVKNFCYLKFFSPWKLNVDWIYIRSTITKYILDLQPGRIFECTFRTSSACLTSWLTKWVQWSIKWVPGTPGDKSCEYFNFTLLFFLITGIRFFQKQSLEVASPKGSSETFCKANRKTPVSVVFFNKTYNFIKRKLQNSCFHVSFVKFSKTAVL